MTDEARDGLVALAALAREFGGNDHVIGGGGNVSFKTDATLCIKPSGCFLNAMTPDAFVALDREALSGIRTLEPSPDKRLRERQVREVLESALLDKSARRPSVETPLHHALASRFVAHTHPAPVNGMTCSREGRQACARLFPDALWVDYADPGYVLALTVGRAVDEYRRERGCEPRALFLQNHGLFWGADTPDTLRETYARIAEALRSEYAGAGLDDSWATGPLPSDRRQESLRAVCRAAVGDEAACLAASGPFAVAEGPITPDHIVYGRAWAMIGEPDEARLAAYCRERGLPPRVIACEDGVYAIGPDAHTARFALDSADNGGQVRRYATAFGGLRLMDDAQRAFIENWEGEAYRLHVAVAGQGAG